MKHTTRMVITALGLALGACTGSGDDGRSPGAPAVEPTAESPAVIVTTAGDALTSTDEPVPEVGRGRLSGRVVDASDGRALVGATVFVRQPGVAGFREPLARTTSGRDGRYTFDGLPEVDGRLAVDISLDGYVAERIDDVRVVPLDGVSLERVRLVPVATPDEREADVGSLAGRLVDADGAPLAGTAIEFTIGIGGTAGEGTIVTTTDAEGRWSVEGLAYGNWTCLIYGPDGAVTAATVTVAEPERDGLEAVALPALAADERLIVVTRGDWFQLMSTKLTAPDDDIDPATFGPLPRTTRTEPGGTQVTRVMLGTGTLRFWLTKHPIANDFSQFEPTVRVIGPGGVIATYTEGVAFGSGWLVFDMDLESGALTTGGRRS